MNPTITLDATKAIARFSEGGIPETVRNNLRQIIPDLTKRLGNVIENKLDTELQSRRRLTVDKQMREDSHRVVGQVTVRWTGEASKHFIPQILETGARAHPIYAKNAAALSFFWAKLGMNVAFKSVWHPGFPGIHYAQRSFQEMEDEILDSMTDAVMGGARRKAA